jgi:hypothetical protein
MEFGPMRRKVGGLHMRMAVKDAVATGRGNHEHDWCEIPLHEDSCICALCGEVREARFTLSPHGDAPDYLLCGEFLPMTFSI